MTLKEWSDNWPYLVRPHGPTAMVTPDAGFGDAHRAMRNQAFNLSDYVVSAVTGGSLWFWPRGRQGGHKTWEN